MASAPQSMCPGYSGDGAVIIDMLHMCNLLFGLVALHADGVAVSIPRQLMWGVEWLPLLGCKRVGMYSYA